MLLRRGRCTRSGPKLRTLPGTWWLLLAVVALTIAVGAAAAAAATARRPAARASGADPAKISLSGIDLGQAVVALLAVLAISGEYGTGMIRVTLTAMPRRLMARRQGGRGDRPGARGGHGSPWSARCWPGG